LLPNYLSVSGKTRQNDLDVGFTISINPGASTTTAGIQNGATNQTNELVNDKRQGRSGNQENRQAFLTFGDASWGSVKVGKDLGIFASDAILNDMTLLGVGAGAGSLAGNTTTLGRIGTGFIYADWKAQIAYTTPNWNGFQATAGLTQAFDASSSLQTPNKDANAFSGKRGGSQSAYEAKASYEWTGDVAGKVWMSAITQKFEDLKSSVSITSGVDNRATAFDIGTTVNVAGFGLTGYYYTGRGLGQTVQFNEGFDPKGSRRDSDGWYVQGTYVVPGVSTKLGVSYGLSTLDGTSHDKTVLGVGNFKKIEDSMWTIGAYHPLTKHLNLVAEYSQSQREVDSSVVANDLKAKAKTVSLGAILFF